MKISRAAVIEKYNLDRLILYMKGRTFDVPEGLLGDIIFTPDPKKCEHPPIRHKGILSCGIDLTKFDVVTGVVHMPYYSSTKFRPKGSFEPYLSLVFEQRPLSDLNHENIAFAWVDNHFLAHLSVLSQAELIDLIKKLHAEDPDLCKRFCGFMLWQGFYSPKEGDSSY